MKAIKTRMKNIDHLFSTTEKTSLVQRKTIQYFTIGSTDGKSLSYCCSFQ